MSVFQTIEAFRRRAPGVQPHDVPDISPALRAGLAAFPLVFLAYAYQTLNLTLNSDDVAQIRGPLDLSGGGRWLLNIIYNQVLRSSPAPGFSSAVGLAFQIAASVLCGRMLGLKNFLPLLAIAVLGSTHLTLQYLFSFEIMKLSVPAANFLAILGLYIGASNLILGSLIFSLAPAIYQVSVEFGAVAIGLFCLANLAGGVPIKTLLRSTCRLALCAVLGLIVYYATLRLGDAVGWLQLGRRTEIGGFDVLDRAQQVLTTILAHTIPGHEYAYRDHTYKWPALISCGLLLAATLPRPGRFLLSLATMLLLFAVPMGLMLVTKYHWYPDRTAYGYALVFGGVAALAIAHYQIQQRTVFWIAVACAGVIYFAHSTAIARRSFDEHLAYQADMAVVNRMIARIEMLDEAPDLFRGPVPLAVVGKLHWRARVPAGWAFTNRNDSWSRENVFRVLDDRFVVATTEQRRGAERAAASRPGWPHKDSIFVHEGVVVVVVSNE